MESDQALTSEEAPVAPVQVLVEVAPVAPVVQVEVAPVAPVQVEVAPVAPVEDVTIKEADMVTEEAVSEAKDTPSEAAVSPPLEEKNDTEDNAAAAAAAANAEQEAPKETPLEPDKAATAAAETSEKQEEGATPMEMETDDKPAAAALAVAVAEEETKPEVQVQVKPEQAGEEPEDDAEAIWEPAEPDVLSGRGASVNAHGGNKKFRALCFCRKPEFDAGNHAAKRRIATEIVTATTSGTHARFLKKKKGDKGAWFEMNLDQAILKACQVMRDYKRPDRLAIREMMAQNGSARKRQRTQESTPMIDIVSCDTALYCTVLYCTVHLCRIQPSRANIMLTFLFL